MAVFQTKRKKRVWNSMMFRSWIAFIILSLGIIVAAWVAEAVIFTAYYRKMHYDSIVKANEQLIGKLEHNNFSVEAGSFRRAADEAVLVNRMSVMLFVFEQGSDVTDPSAAKVLFLRTPMMVESGVINVPSAKNVLTEDFLRRMDEVGATGSINYIQGETERFAVVYGEKMIAPNGDTLYYFSTSMVFVDNATVDILLSQLKSVTSLCLIVAVLVSFLIAWRFSKPIRQFTATARKIGDGDLTVKYVGNGYNEFDELAAALNYSTSEIIRAENLRHDFLANVSHDMRTPLTLVKAYAEMIRDISGDNKEKRIKNAQIIIDEVDRLTLLIEDILDLSKLQSGTAEMQFESVDISDAALGAIKSFDVLQQKGYVISSDIEENLTVVCDYKRLTQVIYNLIGNAINYVGEDMTVLVSVKRTDSGSVRMEITDHGKGIPESEIDKVWDRYYRSNQNKRNVVGSGIGLSIVKSILIGFGARYGIISKDGEGTTFWFELAGAGAEKNKKEQ